MINQYTFKPINRPNNQVGLLYCIKKVSLKKETFNNYTEYYITADLPEFL